MPADSNAVPGAPAPWELEASAYILVLKLPPELRDGASVTPPELRAARTRSPLSYAMFVDYARSPVGPYHELLFIPGAFRYGARSCFTITRIYVSSQASVVNGRRNWALPKELAAFEVEYGGDRIDRVRMSVNGRRAAELVLRHYPVGLPLLSSLIPAGLRTLGQRDGDRLVTVTPRARAALRAGKLLAAEFDPALFPAFAPRDVVAAVKLPHVAMHFPEAVVLPAAGA